MLRNQVASVLKAEPDKKAVLNLYQQYATYYSGKLILQAMAFWNQGDFPNAAYAFEKARDGFQEKKNPDEWNALETWRVAAETKGVEAVAKAYHLRERIEKHLGPGDHPSGSPQSVHGKRPSGSGADFVYHGTPAGNLESIKKYGLRPNEYGNPLNFHENSDSAKYYTGGRGYLLRVARSSFPGGTRADSLTRRLWTDRPIPPDVIDVQVGGDWVPLEIFVKKHLGPGNHPSGSPQSVHGNENESTGQPYPLVGEKVDGRTVIDEVDNIGSISASLYDYEILDGIREVPMKGWDASPEDMFYAADDIRRSKELAEGMKVSGTVKPLIIVVDKDGPYILEGVHRLAALYILGAKSFPALVVEEAGARYPTAKHFPARHDQDAHAGGRGRENWLSGALDARQNQNATTMLQNAPSARILASGGQKSGHHTLMGDSGQAEVTKIGRQWQLHTEVGRRLFGDFEAAFANALLVVDRGFARAYGQGITIKHLGPGDHPSGSPQSVHGTRMLHATPAGPSTSIDREGFKTGTYFLDAEEAGWGDHIGAALEEYVRDNFGEPDPPALDLVVYEIDIPPEQLLNDPELLGMAYISTEPIASDQIVSKTAYRVDTRALMQAIRERLAHDRKAGFLYGDTDEEAVAREYVSLTGYVVNNLARTKPEWLTALKSGGRYVVAVAVTPDGKEYMRRAKTEKHLLGQHNQLDHDPTKTPGPASGVESSDRYTPSAATADELERRRSSVEAAIAAAETEQGDLEGVAVQLAGPGYKFKVGDKEFTAAGEYNPKTGQITMFDEAFPPFPLKERLTIDEFRSVVPPEKLAEAERRFAEADEQVRGILSHEVQHHVFATATNAYEAQKKELYDLQVEYDTKGIDHQGPLRADETLRTQYHQRTKDPNSNVWTYAQEPTPLQWKEKYPLYDALRSTWGEWDFRTLLAKLDGVSSYSKAYWESYEQHKYTDRLIRAIDETLAEVAYFKLTDETKFKALPSRWRKLYAAMQKAYRLSKGQKRKRKGAGTVRVDVLKGLGVSTLDLMYLDADFQPTEPEQAVWVKARLPDGRIVFGRPGMQKHMGPGRHPSGTPQSIHRGEHWSRREVYHGTSTKAAKRILKEGLRLSKSNIRYSNYESFSTRVVESAYIFAARELSLAQTYGRHRSVDIKTSGVVVSKTYGVVVIRPLPQDLHTTHEVIRYETDIPASRIIRIDIYDAGSDQLVASLKKSAGKNDELYVAVVFIEDDYEIAGPEDETEKHLGPGDHPSGSPQAVHAGQDRIAKRTDTAADWEAFGLRRPTDEELLETFGLGDLGIDLSMVIEKSWAADIATPFLLLHGRLNSGPYEEEIVFTRTFYRYQEQPTAHHAIFELRDKYQRQGLGVDLLERSEALYRRIGVKRISLTANSQVGRYAWARMGFDFSNESDRREVGEQFQSYLLAADVPDNEWPDVNHPWEIAAWRPKKKYFRDNGTREITGKDFLLHESASYDAVKALDPDDPGYQVGQAYYRERRKHRAETTPTTKAAHRPSERLEGGADDRWYHDPVDGPLDEAWREAVLDMRLAKYGTPSGVRRGWLKRKALEAIYRFRRAALQARGVPDRYARSRLRQLAAEAQDAAVEAWRAEPAVRKHAGPGEHPGTGTSQAVHGGQDGDEAASDFERITGGGGFNYRIVKTERGYDLARPLEDASQLRRFRPDEPHDGNDVTIPELYGQVKGLMVEDTSPPNPPGLEASSFRLWTTSFTRKAKDKGENPWHREVRAAAARLLGIDPGPEEMVEIERSDPVPPETLTAAARNLLEGLIKAPPDQPVLWRGIDYSEQYPDIVEKKRAAFKAILSLKAGDTFDLPLVSTSRDAQIASTYGGTMGESHEDYTSIIFRIQPRARGIAVRGHYLHDQEVITGGRFRVHGIRQMPGKGRFFIFDIEQMGIFNPDTRELLEKARARRAVFDWLFDERQTIGEIKPIAKHLGPGEHPSGSSQDVHGNRLGRIGGRQGEVISRLESQIYDRADEVAFIINKNGDGLRFDGDVGEVRIRGHHAGEILTHNHPNGSNFSKNDLQGMIWADLDEVRAVLPDGTYYSIRKASILGWWGKSVDRVSEIFDSYLSGDGDKFVSNLRQFQIDTNQPMDADRLQSFLGSGEGWRSITEYTMPKIAKELGAIFEMGNILNA